MANKAALRVKTADGKWTTIPALVAVESGGGGGVSFTTDETLSLENGVLSVNRATDAEPDNTLPITSAAVYAEIGNINVLLETI